MDPTSGPTAADLVADWTESQLAEIFFRYGEERHSRRLAAAIVRERERKPFLTTVQLADFIVSLTPSKVRMTSRIHPATRVFQALRIAVNRELDELESSLAGGIPSLLPGGRFSVISFHSLEDRIVKQTFVHASRTCVCPPGLPVCRCGHRPTLSLVTRKPVEADDAEVQANPRARSAKLRVAERRP